MAEISVETGALPGGRVSRYQWLGAAAGDTFQQVYLPDLGAVAASMQVEGLSAGAIALHGSNDGATFYPLDDVDGNAIGVSADGISEIRSTAIAFIKPVLTGGDGGDDITITLVTRA